MTWKYAAFSLGKYRSGVQIFSMFEDGYDDGLDTGDYVGTVAIGKILLNVVRVIQTSVQPTLTEVDINHEVLENQCDI